MNEPADNRHARQAILPEIGNAGQERLASGHAAIVGCGALGTVAAELLVRAGVGRVTLIDRDLVEASNLQRQTLFDDADARESAPKAEAARRRLIQIAPSADVRARVADLTRASAEPLLLAERPDVIMDGTDNYETRFLLNDIAVKHGVPLVYGGALGTRGMAALIEPGRGPCLRCVFEGPPVPGSHPTCETAGVLGAATAIVGARQAALAMRVLVGAAAIDSAIEQFDAWTGRTHRTPASRDAECVCCAQRRFEFLDGEGDDPAAALCGRDAVQIPGGGGDLLDLDELARRLASAGAFHAGPFVLRGEVEGGRYSLTVFADGRTIVHGTRDVGEARAVHARYVGA